jgi:hypothetical protein
VAARLPGDALERDIDEFLELSARKDALLRPTYEGLVCTDEKAYRRLVSRMMEVQGRIERAWAALQGLAR